jgi:hypothetical protein
MHRRPALAGQVDLRDEIVPVRELTADLPLWQLEHHGGQRLRDGCQILDRQQLVRVTGRVVPQSVDGAESLLLPHRQVVRRVRGEGDATAAPGVHPQRHLLGHRTGREEQRRRGTEQVGDPLLQHRDRPVRTAGRGVG